MKQLIRIAITLALMGNLGAQEKLSLAQAIKIALEKNYDIQIAKNAQISNDIGVTRTLSDNFLPGFSISNSATYVNSSQEQFVGQVRFGTQETDDVFYDASMGINLQINDVYQSLLTYFRSMDANAQQKYTTMNDIAQTIKTVMQGYYNLAEQQNLLNVRKRAVETSQQQVQRAQSRYEIGSAAKKDVMSQRVQLNNDRSALLNQQLQVQTAQNTLNISLGRNPFEKIAVDENVAVDPKYKDYNAIETQMTASNPEWKALQQGLKVSEIDEERAVAALFYPSLSFSTGYNRRVNNELELGNMYDRWFDFNTNFSATASMSLSWNFNWGQNLAAQQAELAKKNALLNKSKREKQLKAQLYQAFITYQNALQQLTLQEQNVEAAREDLRLAQERFNLGSGTSIDLRQAQDGLTNAEVNLVSAKYDAKLAEVEIDRLLGRVPTN